MADMKKEFQKVVKEYRNRQETPSEHPKAMMTEQQMRKGTATVNCGRSDYGKNLAENFIKDEQFAAWCKAFSVKTIEIEVAREASYMKPQYQIRVTY